MSGDQPKRTIRQSWLAFGAIAIVALFFLWGGVTLWQELRGSQPPDCALLTSAVAVQAVLDAHRETRTQIEGLGSGVIVEIDSDVCPGKAFVRILYTGAAQRGKIKNILGPDFFSVPYTLHNI